MTVILNVTGLSENKKKSRHEPQAQGTERGQRVGQAVEQAVGFLVRKCLGNLSWGS